MNVIVISIEIVMLAAILYFIALLVVVAYRGWKGELQLVKIYSYRPIFMSSLILISVGVCIALVNYFLTSSFEAFITIILMTIAIVFVASVRVFHGQYCIKRRGGKKAD